MRLDRQRVAFAPVSTHTDNDAYRGRRFDGSAEGPFDQSDIHDSLSLATVQLKSNDSVAVGLLGLGQTPSSFGSSIGSSKRSALRRFHSEVNLHLFRHFACDGGRGGASKEAKVGVLLARLGRYSARSGRRRLIVFLPPLRPVGEMDERKRGKGDVCNQVCERVFVTRQDKATAGSGSSTLPARRRSCTASTVKGRVA